MKLLIGFLVLGFALADTIDFTQQLTGIDGKPLMNGDAKTPVPMTLGDAAVLALESQIEEDRTTTGDAKFKQDELARKIYKNAKASLTVEEIASIKTRIGKVFPPMTVGAAWRLLDPSLKEKVTEAKK